MQVAVVALVTAKLLHRLPPILMLVAPVRSVPVMVILVPPKLMPEVGDTEVTVGGEGGGGGVTKVNNELAAVVPLGVVTATLTAPLLPEGVVQVAVIALVTLNDAHGEPPMVMPVAPVKLDPMMVMSVPPVGGPLSGDTAEIAGGG
jgi:hypothetical protein